MGSIATQAQKSNQAAQMAATAKPTDNPLIMAFDRLVSMVKGIPCTQDGHPNGHITTQAATYCAQTRAENFLASLPDTTTQEQALEALGQVQILTIDRYMCLSAPAPADWTPGQPLPQKCKFGHKTLVAAQSCVGTQASPKAKAASMVQVTMGGSLKATQATQAQTPEATPEATQAKPRLTSGSKGNTGRA